jgi:DNA-binding transcriptional ArsR family regulator
MKQEISLPRKEENIHRLDSLKSALLSHSVRNLINRIAGPLAYKIIHGLICELNSSPKDYIGYTYEQWEKFFDTSYSQHTIRQYMKRLEKVGLVESCQPEKLYRRKWYRLNLEKLEELLIDRNEDLIATVKDLFVWNKKASNF